MGVGVVAGAGDGAEKEPLAFSKGRRVSLPHRRAVLSFCLFESCWFVLPMAQGAMKRSAARAPRWRGLASAKRWGFGERACAVRCWGGLHSGRMLRDAAAAGRRGLPRRTSRLRHAPPAGAPDPRARCYHLRQIWGSTLGTVVPEVVAARVRRALVATRRRPPYAVDSAIDVRQPSHGVHSVGAAQLSHALLNQECAPREDDLSRQPARAGVYPGRARKAVIYSYSQGNGYA